MKKVLVKCKECGKEELVFPSRAKNYVCCSVVCMGMYNSKKHTQKLKKECAWCGKVFLVKPSHFDRRKCCSYECHCASLPNKYRGAGNPNYKGNLLNSDGYELDINHKEKKHRAVCKQILGILVLPKGYDVHHIDCNKLNNSPENLVLLNKSSHVWLHKQFGNATLKAFVNKKILVDKLIEWSDDAQRAARLLDLTCIKQSLYLKQGELLEDIS